MDYMLTSHDKLVAPKILSRAPYNIIILSVRGIYRKQSSSPLTKVVCFRKSGVL